LAGSSFCDFDKPEVTSAANPLSTSFGHRPSAANGMAANLILAELNLIHPSQGNIRDVTEPQRYRATTLPSRDRKGVGALGLTR
jgi:hypothetical protein